MAYTPEQFHQILLTAVKNEVSDIHLRMGERPYLRAKGALKSLKGEPLTKQDMLTFCQILIPDKEILSRLDKLKEYDGSYQFGAVCRVRVNLLRFQGKIAIILRVITMQIPTIEQLGLPIGVRNITKARRGLVLVTGVTGSGKSSTLAAMLEEINNHREEHILTIEDPVEFLFTSKKSRFTQREIGGDTDCFKDALRGALRQDPDIIVIGELRDAETIQIAMKAAETGHLVFGTVHTTNALTTINRVVSMFPPEEQDNVKQRLGDCLHATISQRLLPTKNGKGRVVAQEIMVNSVGIRDCIIGKEPLSNMYITIEKAKKDGTMQAFDQHLTDLFKKDIISYEVALDAASSPNNFERNLQFGDSDDEDKPKKRRASVKTDETDNDEVVEPEEDEDFSHLELNRDAS